MPSTLCSAVPRLFSAALRLSLPGLALPPQGPSLRRIAAAFLLHASYARSHLIVASLCLCCAALRWEVQSVPRLFLANNALPVPNVFLLRLAIPLRFGAMMAALLLAPASRLKPMLCPRFTPLRLAPLCRCRSIRAMP